MQTEQTMPEKKTTKPKARAPRNTKAKPSLRDDRPLGLRVSASLAEALEHLSTNSPLSVHAVALAALHQGLTAMLADPKLLEKAHWAMLEAKKNGYTIPVEKEAVSNG